MSIQPLPSIAPARSIYFAEVLMARASITPQDAGCQSYLIYKLEKLGFFCEKYTINGVSNLIARWGQGPNHFAFSGHTDVVPPGPLDKWKSPPFSPVISKNKLYGRGAADMKTGIAAMLAATERTIASLDKEKVSFWWLITSDEEGEAEWGSKWIAEYLASKNVQLDMCLVGEPSASASTGDTIKIGRRGSLSGTIHIAGKQGHVAYPKTAGSRGVEGYVVLSLLISATGEIEKVQVLESSPSGVFEDAALQGVRNWRFEPAQYQGRNVKVWARQRVRFDLS